jgi:hypothetical protein
MKMVLADRNPENARRDINGRARSRNTSPNNGHHQTDSSDDDCKDSQVFYVLDRE